MNATTVPLTDSCDVLVVGATGGAVAAAVAAQRAGARTVLASNRTYLGTDMAGQYRLWLEGDEEPSTGLARAIFGVDRLPPTPMHVKRVLDDAVIDAGVRFLFNAYPLASLRDEEGRCAGVLLATRAGVRGLKAKVVIDATARGTVARMAGVAFTPYTQGEHTFHRIVLGGPPPEGAGCRLMPFPSPVTVQPFAEDEHPRELRAWECRISVSMTGDSPLSFACAEQEAVSLTWTPEELLASEGLFELPPDRVDGVPEGPSDSPDTFACPGRPLYLLGGCAALSREDAGRLVRPCSLLAAGERVGAAAARRAASLAEAGALTVAPHRTGAAAGGALRFVQGDIRPSPVDGTIEVPADVLPLLGEYDVVVVGGGTAGAPAGIGAGRNGARTLVCEALHGLGGVATLGLIGRYWHGNRVGFTEEIDRGVAALMGVEPGPKVTWNIRHKAAWFHRRLTDAGARICYGSLGMGALVEGDTVIGTAVATPYGAGIVRARAVIDSTGNVDIAAAAGAACVGTGSEHVAVQGAGLPPRRPEADYTNTDYTFIDDSDDLDTVRAFVCARRKFAGAFDVAQLIDTRQRRQIVGDATVTPEDIYLAHTWRDTITIARSNFDSHGYTVHPLFLVLPPDRQSRDAAVPWRCLLPRGLENIAVTGLGISGHRDAMPILRMQPDVQNHGYAAGVGAAMAVAAGTTLRALDIAELQRHLVDKGIIPESCLADRDPEPVSDEAIREVVDAAELTHESLAVLFTAPARSIPLLAGAFQASRDETLRLRYAHILGLLGDTTGAETLARAVAAADWDEGWNFRGMGQFGMSMSRLDSLIVAAGRTKFPSVLGPVIDKLRVLEPSHEFSHCRAVAVALETLRAPEAAPHLAALLSKPGVAGHAWTDLAAALDNIQKSRTDNTTRTASLRELVLARALYRCGDHEGIGRRILKSYAEDVRGHYARHARGVLEEGCGQAIAASG